MIGEKRTHGRIHSVCSMMGFLFSCFEAHLGTLLCAQPAPGPSLRVGCSIPSLLCIPRGADGLLLKGSLGSVSAGAELIHSSRRLSLS